MDAKSSDEFVLIGDFNTPHITWLKKGDTLGYSAVSPQDNKANYLIDFVNVFGLGQFNGIPIAAIGISISSYPQLNVPRVKLNHYVH